MEKMFNDLKSKYEKLYDELSRLKGEVIRYEFSKGGNVFFRGLYTPYLSFRYGLFSNRPGRFIKTDKNFTFKYGFNSDNQLIYVLRNLDGIYTEEYILYHTDCEIGLCFDQRLQLLTDITVCKYGGRLLTSVHRANVMDWGNCFSFSLTEEIYQYHADALIGMEEITGDTKYPTRYHILYDVTNDEFKLIRQWITK